MQLFRALWVCLAVALFAAPALADTGRRDAETESFVRGFVRFLAYHEAGHLLMGQIANLNTHPDWSAADREDYADKLATILLQPDADDPDGIDEIISAVAGWLQVDTSLLENQPHAPPQDRAYDILCLVYGSDPASFAEFEEILDPSSDCTGLYQAMREEMDSVFRDYGDEMGHSVAIVYGPPTGGMEAARSFLIESQVAEDLKLDLEADFYLTHRTTIQAMSCAGKAKPDTFYFDTVRAPNPENDHFVITLCYEMIDARLKYGMRGFEDEEDQN
ncbi:DUF4344 domain-containing metallopeptidase [Hyphomonas sp.]|uniref:DUF4344 domain-containing metallopeptidase n=1 Tax=Hyphomonas sp. TaxID=87 RepID=UPI00391C8C39